MKQIPLTDEQKRMASGTYRRQIKRMVKLITGLRGLRRLPRRPNRPASDVKKQEAHDKTWPTWATQPDKAGAHFWATPYTFEERRRQQSPSEKLVDALKAADANAVPKTSLAY